MSEIDNIFFTPLLAIKIVFEYIIHAREPKIKSHIIKSGISLLTFLSMHFYK